MSLCLAFSNWEKLSIKVSRFHGCFIGALQVYIYSARRNTSVSFLFESHSLN